MPSDRYQALGVQAEWQPGSSEQVLRNKLGITSTAAMDEAELHLLLELYEHLMGDSFPGRRLDVADLMEWHRLWLGNVYDWAGQTRSVNIGKGGFQFATAGQIQRLLDEFERDCLHRFTPCAAMAEDPLVQAIAVCHVEFILIHPFREGNGRLSRLLADVMAVQSGYGPLDYSAWDANKSAYFAAIQHGLARNYAPMQQWVRNALAAPGA